MGPEICLFGLTASNRTIISEICCCDVFLVQVVVSGGWNCRLVCFDRTCILRV